MADLRANRGQEDDAQALDALLVGLSDPDRARPDTLSLDTSSLGLLLERAQFHGVFPILWRKLHDHPVVEAMPGDDGQALIARSQAIYDGLAGQCILLRLHEARVMEALHAAQIPATVVKGPVFARLLYARKDDRSYTDIDVLIASDQIVAANEMIASLGFIQRKRAFRDHSEDYQEYKWILPDNDQVMIEAQANLVHYKNLRRKVPFGYAQLQQISDSDVEAPVPQLIISVVHGALGHKLHKLSLVVDILQAARRLTNGDIPTLITAARELGLGLEVMALLRLAGQLFNDREILALADRMPGRWAGLSDRLLTRNTILGAQGGEGWDSKLRRHAFRWMQRAAMTRRTR
jgi:hypothetical protein